MASPIGVDPQRWLHQLPDHAFLFLQKPQGESVKVQVGQLLG
jgi:hypothetical protein